MRRCSALAARAAGKAVFVDGVRTPFLMNNTGFKDYIAQDLGRFAIKGLITKTAVDPKDIDYVVMGTVIQEVKTSNIARESALGAGIPDTAPAHTVTMACISACQAVTTVASLINSGQIDVAVAGGAETMSDVPIRFSKEMRKRFIASQKYKTPMDWLKFFKGFQLGYLAPEAPAIAEFSTGEVMGHSSDRLDAFALASHHKAAKATAGGVLLPEIAPVDGLTADNGIRGDATAEKLASLKPAFVKPHGTHTAANSSFLTDGGSAALIMSEDAALARGLTPKARIVDWIYVSQDPREELLLGPAYAVTRLMHRNGLRAIDVDVWEIHEAFAGQVLANLAAMESDRFLSESVRLPGTGGSKVGAIPPERINAWGGSLAIGHPFGATGTRLLTTSANRLATEGGRFAVMTACAAGGQAHAMLIERYDGRASAAGARK